MTNTISDRKTVQAVNEAEDNEQEESSSQQISTDKVLKKMRTSVSRDQIRQLNDLKVNVPNFLVIGAQKSGTTWLHANLKKHPEVLLPSGKKELEFFSYQSKLDSPSLSNYLSHFNKISHLLLRPRLPKAIGEATPSYFWSIDPSSSWANPPQGFNCDIPSSVANMLGQDIKLILCLRNPVLRAVSAYLHHVRFNRIDYTKQGILEVGHHFGIIDMGFYYKHLSAWLETFKLDNFKVLIYERDIKKNKEKTLEDLCSFLDINPLLFPASDSINEFHNKGITYRITSDGVFVKTDDASDEGSLAIRQEELEAISKIYRDDTSQLEKLLGSTIPEWKL